MQWYLQHFLENNGGILMRWAGHRRVAATVSTGIPGEAALRYCLMRDMNDAKLDRGQYNERCAWRQCSHVMPAYCSYGGWHSSCHWLHRRRLIALDGHWGQVLNLLLTPAEWLHCYGGIEVLSEHFRNITCLQWHTVCSCSELYFKNLHSTLGTITP